MPTGFSGGLPETLRAETLQTSGDECLVEVHEGGANAFDGHKKPLSEIRPGKQILDLELFGSPDQLSQRWRTPSITRRAAAKAASIVK